MKDVRTRLAECFRVVVPEVSPQELATTSLETVGGWDSIAATTLMTVIEEEFNITLRAADIDRLSSFPRTLEAVERELS